MATRTVLQTDVAINSGSAATVGTTEGALVSANTNRRSITITNDNGLNTVYLSLGGTAVANSGVRLNTAGGSYTTLTYTGAIRAISTGASTNVLIVEL